MEKENTELYIPSLRGFLGNRMYYLCLMKLKDVAERIKFANEIYSSDKLNELLQRDVLPQRASEIASYLKDNEQRFFNAITVGVFGGMPEWIEFKVNETTANKDLPIIPLKDSGIWGYLKFNGQELLFPIDGQHRLAGIKKLAEENTIQASEKLNKILDDEVSVIFIGHKRDEDGKRSIRRIFSTLNRNAKAVALKDIIALDEDDIVAIITRDLIEKHTLFVNDRISLALGSSINPRDKKAFTNIATLYKCNELLIRRHLNMDSSKTWSGYKNTRPEEPTIEKVKKWVFEVWDTYLNSFPILASYIKDPQNIVGRDQATGGNLLFRPIGLLILTKALTFALKEGSSVKSTLKSLSKVSLNLNTEPWVNVLWEAGSKRMNVRDVNQKVSLGLLLYMMNLNLSVIKYDEKKLVENYASLLNKDIKLVKLPKKLTH